MAVKTNCECCANYVYDYEYDCYYCDVNLDEDEMSRFMSNTLESCSYFQLYDEYKIVRKQI